MINANKNFEISPGKFQNAKPFLKLPIFWRERDIIFDQKIFTVIFAINQKRTPKINWIWVSRILSVSNEKIDSCKISLFLMYKYTPMILHFRLCQVLVGFADWRTCICVWAVCDGCFFKSILRNKQGGEEMNLLDKK